MSPIRLLIALRGGIGFGAVLAPGLAARMLGFDSHRQLAFLVRIIGIRDVALAIGLGAAGKENERLWVSLGLLCDASDGVSGVVAGRGGTISRLSTVLATAPAALGCAMGLVALRR